MERNLKNSHGNKTMNRMKNRNSLEIKPINRNLIGWE